MLPRLKPCRQPCAIFVAALLIGGLPCAQNAYALDKQGSAHGGQVAGADSGLHFSGTGAIGTALYNPTYAARPDNSGKALMRYALHFDVDLIGRRLSIPIDINTFTDRQRRGLLKLSPSELDLIGGLTTTWPAGPGALELGIRGETDRPVDRGVYSQSYVDARLRYLLSAASLSPGVKRSLRGGDVTGVLTLGTFAVNPSYAARPDNSGRALMRYAVHTEVSLWEGHAALGLDGTFFTDRSESAFRPSECDFTPELISRWDPFEFHLAYERDMPIDGLGSQPGYVQSLVYALAVWAFDPSVEDVKGPSVTPRGDETRQDGEQVREAGK